VCRLNLSYFDLVCLASAAPAAFIAIAPIFHYSRYGYRERRQEVLEYFLGKEIAAYYKKFYRARYSEKEEPSASHFAQFYDQRFGWDSYRVPLVGYIVALTVATGWIIGAVLHVKGADDPRFREVAYALTGAYIWVIFDLLYNFSRRDIVPSRLYAYTFRFVIIIPIAYVIGAFLSESAKPTALIALGCFPTNTLYKLVRRQGVKTLKLADEGTNTRYELEAIQGINASKAERFLDAGVDTIMELAFQDPIQLTMRTNFPLRYVIDVMSQAVLYIYLPYPNILRRYAIRSSMDVASLYSDFYRSSKDKDREAKKRAIAIVEALAKELKLPVPILLKVLNDIMGDPANEFLTDLPF
jgi:hypothetical protein